MLPSVIGKLWGRFGLDPKFDHHRGGAVGTGCTGGAGIADE
jgi:hypothetical protein